jgi:hypothetical protein
MTNRLNKTRICSHLSFHFDKSDLKKYLILQHTKEYHICHQHDTDSQLLFGSYIQNYKRVIHRYVISWAVYLQPLSSQRPQLNWHIPQHCSTQRHIKLLYFSPSQLRAIQNKQACISYSHSLLILITTHGDWLRSLLIYGEAELSLNYEELIQCGRHIAVPYNWFRHLLHNKRRELRTGNKLRNYSTSHSRDHEHVNESFAPYSSTPWRTSNESTSHSHAFLQSRSSDPKLSARMRTNTMTLPTMLSSSSVIPHHY